MVMAYRTLSHDQIQRIESFRISGRLDIVRLKMAMNAPFRWPTLLRALSGKPVSEATYCFLLSWLDRYLPVEEVSDGKAAAAGSRADEAVPCSK
jgi:hypothetical protein